MRTIVQISLDVIDIQEAISTGETALRAGVDWLEAGTPLILAEECMAYGPYVSSFPKHPSWLT